MPNKKILQKIPEHLQNDPLTEYLQGIGLRLISQGKVRNIFRIDKDRLLIVATDRISIFDFVLNTLVPYKGETLTALTHFWGWKLREAFPNMATHLIQSSINPIYNAAYDLKKQFPDLPLERSLVVRDLSGFLDPFELIFRNHIGGSVYDDYKNTGIVSGQEIPRDLPEWSRLEDAIFSPSTKEERKHDINVTDEHYYKVMGYYSKHFINTLKRVYQFAYWYAQSKGILILDTKFEGSSQGHILADEFLTPDSSRFVEENEWKNAMAQKRQPAFLDKQEIRDWGRSIEVPHQINPINLKKISPDNQMNINTVHQVKVPEDIIESLTDNYLFLLKTLTELNLPTYQQKFMGI
jgi:phosphoribosylaminoimidazole-succinocarboxamide synthase